MELYYIIAVTDRDRAGEMAELYQAAGLHLTLTKLGRGTAPREALSIYGLDATPKAIVSAVADGEMQKQIFKNAKRRMQIDIPGNGVMLAVPLKSVAGARTLAYLTDNREMGGKPSMEFAHELIVVILNEGYSDFVMDADAFGLVALVAMMPLITVQAMGGIYVLKSKRGAEKVTALPYDEREIIELWEAC